MADKIKVEVELDLSDLTSYRVYNDGGEPGYDPVPVSITEAVVQAAARQILMAEQADIEAKVKTTVASVRTGVVEDVVRSWVLEQLEKGVQRTNDWGEPVGEPKPLSEVIKDEITKQLNGHRDRYGSTTRSAIQEVVSAQVLAVLQRDMQAAFNTARDAMLKAAQDAGTQALRAAVTKAVGG